MQPRLTTRKPSQREEVPRIPVELAVAREDTAEKQTRVYSRESKRSHDLFNRQGSRDLAREGSGSSARPTREGNEVRVPPLGDLSATRPRSPVPQPRSPVFNGHQPAQDGINAWSTGHRSMIDAALADHTARLSTMLGALEARLLGKVEVLEPRPSGRPGCTGEADRSSDRLAEVADMSGRLGSIESALSDLRNDIKQLEAGVHLVEGKLSARVGDKPKGLKVTHEVGLQATEWLIEDVDSVTAVAQAPLVGSPTKFHRCDDALGAPAAASGEGADDERALAASVSHQVAALDDPRTTLPEPAAEDDPGNRLVPEVSSVPVQDMLSELNARSMSRRSSGSSWGVGPGPVSHKVTNYIYGSNKPLDIKGMLLRYMFAAVDWWNHLHEPPRVGVLARLTLSSSFETCTICVVILNCAFIIHQNNASMAEIEESGQAGSGTDFLVLDTAFAAYFLIEIILRLLVHRLYFFVNQDMTWNFLDLFIVLISVWQVIEAYTAGSPAVQLAFLRSFRVLKVVRVLRLLRMVKFFTDLRVMVSAFLASCLALFWCIVLLFFTITMFALVIVQVVQDYYVRHAGEPCDMDVCLADQLREHFGSVQGSMLSLFMATTSGNDWSLYYHMVNEASPVAGVFFIFYIAFYTFGVFNLVTGMFVDKAVRASQPDQDMLIFEQRHLERDFTNGFLRIFNDFDHDHDGMVDRQEFTQVIESDAGRIYLGMLGLEPKDSKVVYESLCDASAKVPVGDFVRGCMRMKGGATSLDLNAVKFEVKVVHKSLNLLQRELRDLRKTMDFQRILVKKTFV